MSTRTEEPQSYDPAAEVVEICRDLIRMDTTNYGDQTYSFDVALPISATSLTVNGQSHELTAAKAPDLSAAAPASSSTAAAPAQDNTPGSTDRLAA